MYCVACIVLVPILHFLNVGSFIEGMALAHLYYIVQYFYDPIRTYSVHIKDKEA